MVSGHSHMEVDNLHAAIERTGGDIEVRVPYEWEAVACLAREKTKKPYDVTHVEQEMVNDWKQINKMLIQIQIQIIFSQIKKIQSY